MIILRCRGGKKEEGRNQLHPATSEMKMTSKTLINRVQMRCSSLGKQNGKWVGGLFALWICNLLAVALLVSNHQLALGVCRAPESMFTDPMYDKDWWLDLWSDVGLFLAGCVVAVNLAIGTLIVAFLLNPKTINTV